MSLPREEYRVCNGCDERYFGKDIATYLTEQADGRWLCHRCLDATRPRWADATDPVNW